MDRGLLIGLIAFICFSILFLISINNDIKEKKEKDFQNIIKESSNEEQTNTLLIELLMIEKSSNQKLNIIMWVMLIPIIINIIMLFMTISAINEFMANITSLL